jgi:hypothetical protein
MPHLNLSTYKSARGSCTGSTEDDAQKKESCICIMLVQCEGSNFKFLHGEQILCSYCYWGLKVQGFNKPPKIFMWVYYKDLHFVDPNYHGLLMSRDAHTVQVSQFTL